ncbi:MAG TPA: TIGR03619 family F420-dependent LLM class oxidoreductase [Jatrophihabitans sp.]|nr:TIGR03619 family F420-dependent LLM class oxidoreductase [Jatrophihabitans sp.]
MTGPLLGFGLPVSGSWATAANLTEIAGRAEELGYASLWSFQRLLVPAEGDWGPMYRSVLDPLVSLGFAAAVTSRARLGVAVVNAPFYPAAVLAKQLSTIDVLSGGRLDTGLGLGWADEEFVATGTEKAGRGARLAEFVAAMRACWGPDPVSFDGTRVHIPPARIQPKPVQQPPPILLGGAAPAALQRAGRLADGWISASRHDPATLAQTIDTIKQAAVGAGRDPSGLRFIVRAVLGLTERDLGPQRRMLHGSVGEIRSDLARLSDSGVTEAFLDLNFVPEVGSPDADPVEAMAFAHRVLAAFAPEPPTTTS